MGTQFHVPFWVVLACQFAMGLGTLFGGWRIVKTMGSKITRLTPMQGFCAETGGSITLFPATELGIPVSTTHTITGASSASARRSGFPRCAGASPRHRHRLDHHHPRGRTDRGAVLSRGRDIRLNAFHKR